MVSNIGQFRYVGNIVRILWYMIQY